LQISPLIVNGFKTGFHQWIQHIFLVVVEHKEIFIRKIFSVGFQNLDALYRPVAAKPFVLEDFVLGTGTVTSVASAVTAETIFEIIKCIADVDMLPRRRMGSKCEIFRFFNSGYAHDRNISIFRRRAFFRTGNTLIKPNCASVRQSRDSLHRATHTMTKKVAAAPCSETAGAKKLKKFTETCFLAHYCACKFGLNRLRIDGDIRQKPL